jgi:mRNA interferase RelE/StbE
MSYELAFHPKALKEWKKLDNSVKEQFKTKLQGRLQEPKILKDKLVGFENVYKIKLRSLGYRLAYEVKDTEVLILVLSVGKRENDSVYRELNKRSR